MKPNPTPVTIGRRPALDRDAVAAANLELETAAPIEIVRWAHRRFERVACTASFADTVLIDIATAVDPDIEVIFLDTGFHFAETLTTVRRAFTRYRLNLTVLRPDPLADDVWAAGSTACCDARKVAPLDTYLVNHADAWLSGLRRCDSVDRMGAPIVSIDRRGLVKINPLANFSDRDQAGYIHTHEVTINPLVDDGYASIGCWPCTEPSADRSGRWAGEKTECGLHV